MLDADHGNNGYHARVIGATLVPGVLLSEDKTKSNSWKQFLRAPVDILLGGEHLPGFGATIVGSTMGRHVYRSMYYHNKHV